jgi:hypothetical protein
MGLTKKDINKLKPLPAEPMLIQATPLESIKEIPTIAEEIISRVKYYPTSIPALVPVIGYLLKYYTGINIPDEVILSATGAIWGLLNISK